MHASSGLRRWNRLVPSLVSEGLKGEVHDPNTVTLYPIGDRDTYIGLKQVHIDEDLRRLPSVKALALVPY